MRCHSQAPGKSLECLTFYLFIFVFQTCDFKDSQADFQGEPEDVEAEPSTSTWVVCDISLCIPEAQAVMKGAWLRPTC